MTETVRIAFVCVQNAGRSQMAAAFARQMAGDRSIEDQVEIVSGGTHPAEHVHEVVVDAMGAVGIDIADSVPRTITDDELFDSDYVITMGCAADDVCPANWVGTARDWDLDDPATRPLEEVRTIRDEIEHRVAALLDEVTESE